jgi:hypothetical protein
MKITHLIVTAAIVACTAVAWFVLAVALNHRTAGSTNTMRHEVSGVWGPPLVQQHPMAWYETPNAPGGRAQLLPSASNVEVDLDYDPKQRGLIWHRTYDAAFSAKHVFTNPTKIPQTLYISFPLPDTTAGLTGFEFRLGDDDTATPADPGASGVITRAVLLPASESITLHTRYKTRGTDTWLYQFPDNRRLSGFELTMRTSFPEEDINFPVGTASPSKRGAVDGGFRMVWDFPDILAAPDIGMDMPKQLNAGPVATRIAFFAPVSLLFFVTIVLLIGGIKGIPLHPMHVFFVSAGFFAFHLLFSYLVDIISLPLAFSFATVASVLLVCGYLKAVGGTKLLLIALPAQLLYLVAFTASFFIDGLTGITLTVLAVITLALLMFLTAKVDWRTFLTRKQSAPSTPGILPS